MQPLTVRTADVAAQPWKNGGGVTRELLALPADGDWTVRVSVADVAADGAFSTFDGVERWFAVVDGAGVVLTIDGRDQRCTPGGDAVAFDGATRTTCRLIDGPTRDLNLMLRGTRGALARVVADRAWRPRTRACGLYSTAAGRVRADGDASDVPIAAHALRWWPEAPAAIVFDSAGWWLDADVESAP